MNNGLTYREKFTAEMTWGSVPTDTDYVKGSSLFQGMLERFDKGEFKYLEKEIWKDVEGYEGLYQVSNHGRVKSFDRIDIRDGKEKRLKKGKILKPDTSERGYKRVTLFKNSKKERFLVHRLVLKAFAPNPKNKDLVNHINSNTSDNHLSNLEWVTSRENNTHSALQIKNRKSKYAGACWNNQNKNWSAVVTISGTNKKTYYGFKNEKDAYNRYLLALKELGIENKYLEIS